MTLRETHLEMRQKALDARDRFYRVAAAGEVPTAAHRDLTAAVMRLYDLARQYSPTGRRGELPDVSHVRRQYFDDDLDGTDVAAPELVELIDELDAIVRDHGEFGGVKR